jgi:anthranilate synthase component 1
MSDLQFPSYSEARKLALRGNLVPLVATMPADLETPVGVYLKLTSGKKPGFLLESVEGGERSARYSFIGVEPHAVFRGSNDRYELHTSAGKRKLTGDPYTLIREITKGIKPVLVPGRPRFTGGAVGVFGYDVVRQRERVPHRHADTATLPQVWLGWYDTVFAFDHVQHRLLVVANWNAKKRGRTSYDECIQRARLLVKRLHRRLPGDPADTRAGRTRSNFAPGDFQKAVRKAKSYITAGDIFQVVLSQRFSASFKGDPFTVYRRLRQINPSPYLFYLNCGAFQVAGSSPETLVRVEGRTVTVVPIAGTRGRGRDRAEDLALEQELLADPKERAEHLMLVDLARNDAGRVCRTGGIRLPEFYNVERYSHVMHIVSRVEGDLRRGYDSLDALAACFPAGTVSGAPKVRAMEIIDELENSGRELYAGAAGYLDYFGNLDTCIAIRTLVFAGDRVHAQAGAGIVADSVPRKEELETENKARALLEALSDGG